MKKKVISHLPPIKQLNLTRRHFVKATSALAGAAILSSYGLPLYAASNVDVPEVTIAASDSLSTEYVLSFTTVIFSIFYPYLSIR